MRDEEEDAPSIQKTRPTPIVRGGGIRRGRQGPGSTPDSAFEPARRKNPSASFASLDNAMGKNKSLEARLAPSRFDSPERAAAKVKARAAASKAGKVAASSARKNFGGTRTGAIAQKLDLYDRDPMLAVKTGAEKAPELFKRNRTR